MLLTYPFLRRQSVLPLRCFRDGCGSWQRWAFEDEGVRGRHRVCETQRRTARSQGPHQALESGVGSGALLGVSHPTSREDGGLRPHGVPCSVNVHKRTPVWQARSCAWGLCTEVSQVPSRVLVRKRVIPFLPSLLMRSPGCSSLFHPS